MKTIFFSNDALPIISYTQKENETWCITYKELKKLRESHTCIEYQTSIAQMEKEGIITPNEIPQLKTISHYIQSIEKKFLHF